MGDAAGIELAWNLLGGFCPFLRCHELCSVTWLSGSVREVAKARQIKARVRNDTYLDHVSTTLKSFYAKDNDSAPCSSPFSHGVCSW